MEQTNLLKFIRDEVALDLKGVFDASARAALASGPGYGQPRPSANGACDLVWLHVCIEPSRVEIVFVCQPSRG